MHSESYARSMSSRGQQGTLEQLADGRWKARYRENGRHGKRPQRIFPANKKREAAKWLRDGLDQAEQVQNGNTKLLIHRREQERTGNQACDDFLAAHEASASRLQTLKYNLVPFRNSFGARPLQSIEPYELQVWRKTLSPGYAHDVFKDTKQMLRQATVWHWIPANPADGIKNPATRRAEVKPLPWESVYAVEEEIAYGYEALPVFAAGTGLRPEEYIPLERDDVDLAGRVVHVRRVFSYGVLHELGPDGKKTALQRRTVPLRLEVVERLRAITPRIDTRLLWPARQGGYLDLKAFRDRIWRPAFTAAGVGYQRPYDARHTYATDCIAAGLDMFTLSRRLGTSLKQIDKTYGHLWNDSAERELVLLDAWDATRAVS